MSNGNNFPKQDSPYNNLQNIKYLTKESIKKMQFTEICILELLLFNQIDQISRISDLGFCGPVDRPLNSIYGNLPYISPEVISGKETTFASDIYSIGMLIIFKQNINTSLETNDTALKVTIQVLVGYLQVKFINLQIFLNQGTRQKVRSFNIPHNNDSKILSKVFENMQINSNNNIQNEYEKETIRQIKKNNIDDVNDEIYNNPNFHSEEQDELGIPDELHPEKLSDVNPDLKLESAVTREQPQI
ncbi:hypothetical protein C1645_810218 [Glomus cerebriforme]|uniref:Protein kinase domain-containing protein n=1 Tax=Glomus cerebriforme TaxID=658196 RepID=A0A397S9N1_9GLOM|nr:hypothetical protein C1645_810218 [Glomus cerebriforme]